MQFGITKAAILAIAFAAAARAYDYNALTDVEEAQGFQILFDGSRASFNKNFVNYKTKDSTNVVLADDWQADSASGSMVTAGNAGTSIRSTAKYADFDFRFDYRNDGDGGVFYRFTLDQADAWYTGIEFSILDDQDNCLTCAGAALGLYQPEPLIYRPFQSGEWNHARIVVVKDSVEHWLNGKLVLGFKYHSQDFWTHFDAGKWANSSLTFKVPGNRYGGYIDNGYIGFQALQNDHWQLRSVRVNKEHPALGPDKWWNADNQALGVRASAPASAKPFRVWTLSGSRFLFNRGNLSVTADGRAPN